MSDELQARGNFAELGEGHVLWNRPGFLIRRLNQIHYALFHGATVDFEITPVQYGVLTILALSTDALDQTSLCAEVGVDRTTVADVTRRLAARGLLHQSRSREDGRQKLTRISEAGRLLTDSMFAHMTGAQQNLLLPLGRGERETFVKLLVKLVIAHNERGHTPVRAFE